MKPAGRWQVLARDNHVCHYCREAEATTLDHAMVSARDLEPGLILGRHDSEAAAQGALTTLAQRRVRTAKVLKAPEPSPRYSFRMTDVTADMTAELEPLLIALAGKTLHPCSAPERAPVSPPPSPPQTETQTESAR